MSLVPPLFLFAFVSALASCQTVPASSPAIDLVFAVESDPGRRLSGVRVIVDGKVMGETDVTGMVTAQVSALPDQQLRVEHECPAGHNAPSAAKFLRLRNFERLGEPDSDALQITLRCRPSKRLAVFVVRAENGANLPVRLDGRNVAQTNPLGVAHISISATPGTDFIVELDTRNYPQLRPQRPTHLRSLPDADEIFVVAQSFDFQKMPSRRASRRLRITKIE